jgi:hypothetical protein
MGRESVGPPLSYQDYDVNYDVVSLNLHTKA